MPLLYQLAAIESRFRAMGALRFVKGHAYPVPEREFNAWMANMTANEARTATRSRRRGDRFSRVFREGALA